MIYKEEPLKDKLELVDALQQLGIAYHFKEEINCVLTAIHNSKVQDLSATMNDDIYLVSLLFRLLRTNGFSVSEGGAFEPEESKFRIAQTQANCLLTTVDDTYDVYGSLDELEAFTKAIDQWDISATKALPEYMQLILSAIFDSVENLANGVLERKGLNVSPILRRAWKEFCTASLVQARWYHDGYVPTLEEYLDNGWVSVGAHSIISNAYCINDHVTAKDLEQYSSGYPDKVRYSSVICRLYNDLGTSDDEVKRGDNSKSIQCYMHHKKVTESVARQKIKDLILKYWKLLNGENVGDSAFDKYFRDAVLDVPRMCQFLYQDNDRYGSPDDTKELITLLLLKPIK
ncbi:Terpene synthase [Rhynchospora pubera]|uniref:Terpene synthase n=1 Tax=Rhynchospora pubera TaxID=906938 RepID=A0AAV8FLK8_9POAL|nr:Terpene synthase [Rhynchospora pubera]